jgi:hypothetical protein
MAPVDVDGNDDLRHERHDGRCVGHPHTSCLSSGVLAYSGLISMKKAREVQADWCDSRWLERELGQEGNVEVALLAQTVLPGFRHSC